jgi:hypothetical protein
MCGAVIEVNESGGGGGGGGDSGERRDNDKQVVVVSERAIVNVAIEDAEPQPARDALVDSPEAEQAFVELCRSIEDNDAKLTSVDFGNALGNPTKAWALSLALQHNTVVHTLRIDFDWIDKSVSAVAACALTDYIQSAPPSLLAIEILNATLRTKWHQDDGAAACTILLLLLQAMAKNPALTELTFNNNHNRNCSRSVVMKRQSYATNHRLARHYPPTLQAATIAALPDCTSLDTLWLEHVDDAILQQILQALLAASSDQQRRRLSHLIVVPHRRTMSTATAMALSRWMHQDGAPKMAQRLEQVEFHGVRFTLKLWHCLWNPAKPMAVVAAAATESHPQSAPPPPSPPVVATTPRHLQLSLHDCTLDWAATNSAHTNLLRCRNTIVSSLTLGRGCKLYGGTATALAAMVSAPNCTLSSLDVALLDWDTNGTHTASGWPQLLAALVERSGPNASANSSLPTANGGGTTTTDHVTERRMLERLILGRASTDQDLAVLAEFVPRIRGLKYLEFQLDDIGDLELQVNDTVETADASNPHGAKEPPPQTSSNDCLHTVLTALQGNTTVETCRVNEVDYNLFCYPHAEPSIYDQIMQGL